MSQDRGYKKIKARHDAESRVFTVVVLVLFAVAYYWLLLS